ADGSLPPPRSVALRRHLGSCAACEEVVETLAKGRRVASALPVLAMPDDAREAMLERVATRAAGVLPTVDDVLLAIEEDDGGGPAISPLIVVVAIVVALVLGIGLAAVSTTRTGGPGAADVGQPPPTTSVTPAFSVPVTALSSSTSSAS